MATQGCGALDLEQKYFGFHMLPKKKEAQTNMSQ